MAKSSHPRKSLKKQNRHSGHGLNPKSCPKFKNRRASRCANVEIREPEESDGVWPIVPYIVKTNNQTPAQSSRILVGNSKLRRESRLLRKQSDPPFNIFVDLVKENEKKPVPECDLSAITEEVNNSAISQMDPNESRPSTSGCSADCTIIASEFSLVDEENSIMCSTAENLVLSAGVTGNDDVTVLRTEAVTTDLWGIGSKPSVQSERGINTGKSSDTNCNKVVEVITLSDGQEDDKCGKLHGSKEDDDILVIKLCASSQSTSESPASLFAKLRTATVELSASNMSSYSYRVLRQLIHDLKSAPLPKLDLSHLPFADINTVFADILSEGTARQWRRVLRSWEEIQPLPAEAQKFRICSYNVLCQDTMEKTSFLYKHLREGFMSWDIRSALLAREFTMINADVLCLQEVQDVHFFNFYQPVLGNLGYRGLFKRRTRANVDGCAIFFKSRFDLMAYRPIEYFVSTRCVLDRDNIGQIARLRDKFSKRELCIANTHLLYNTKRGDVKLAQLAVLLAHLDAMCGPNSPRPCPYMICGDFNMGAYCPIYNFLLEGFLDFDGLRRYDLSGQGHKGGPVVKSDFMPPETYINSQCRFSDGRKKVRKDRCWSHSLTLASAHTHFDSYSQPEISSFNNVEALNPDFLFYSVDRKVVKDDTPSEYFMMSVYEGSLKLLRRLALPNEHALRNTLGPWPNITAPSDHAPLIAEFAIV